MTTNEKKAYTETLVILDSLNLSDNVPKELIEIMRSNRDTNWDFTFNSKIPIENQKVLKSTVILLSTIYIAYICKDEQEKEELKKIYAENEKKIIDSYDMSKILNDNKVDNISSEKNDVSNLPTITNESLFEKILNWLKKTLKL